ncbi:MAG: rhomboid family intramembrane serine protease [Saprospiraceae bacterium]|nr:rhomboid family intramembrane serine protease [Saprospiraceae bacterium]MCF8251885.1 rhomboid family intramembrane serine protease [Saprospiraceae bacterium]MCF8283293.1 rhomboid family intramembrane serine protease [Bacteroidales bacterium]MCF8313562.1 rhomboid family intramembrane serine protease [Saprospiraceae bacterium]MCF8443289.1 rhomboid family intramembrane serine protease [Saprospiraceae bacterium]
MFSSVWQDIKRYFSHGNMLTRIILVNIGAFLLLLVAKLLLGGFSEGGIYSTFSHSLMIGAHWQHNLTHPWVFVTHMFLHEGFWHLLWNMLGLYWFGRIVGDLLGDRRVLPIYLISGFAGGMVYFVMANVVPGMGFGDYALGASAAFMGVLVMAGVTAPDYLIGLPLLGGVRLKFIVLFFLILDLVGISSGYNSGGSFGHLGGAAMGFLIGNQLQNGNDMTAPVNRVWDVITSFFENLFSPKRPKPKMAYRNPDLKKQPVGKSARSSKRSSGSLADDLSHQEQIDAILDKIKQTGYDSLSAHEKEFLFNASNK